jgi:predicted RNA-binding protein
MFNSTLALLAGAAVLISSATPVAAQSDDELIEAARTAIKTERRAALADALQLTETEATAFWPVYDKYRAALTQNGDGIKKLVMEYAKLYPDVPDTAAKPMLKELLALEKKQTSLRAEYLSKAGKVLSPAKTLRLAQVESRLDLAVKLELASQIPLVPVAGKIGGRVTTASLAAKGTAGGIAVQTLQIQAKVLAIDAPNRKVTLLGEDGFKETIKIGPEAVNFDQIAVGDVLRVVVTEELVIAVAPENTPVQSGSEALVALAPKGAKPGALLAEAKQIVGTVKAIDTEKRTATLEFENGALKTLPVRPDLDLAKYKVGDKVVIQVTEMIAISVQKN